MAKTPETPIAKLVHDLGGRQAVAERMGRKPNTIRMWEFRKKVPRSIWPELLETYPDKLTMDRLLLTEARAA